MTSDLDRSCIQPQHLTEDALRSYRREFNSHPARLILIQNFLATDLAERLSTFLSTEAAFKPEFGLYSAETGVSEDDFLSAPASDRFFRMHKLVGTVPRFAMSPNALAYLRFRRTFQQGGFKSFFEEVSGLTLGASDDFGSHLMAPGDYLKAHTDDNKNRRLALVIYLSPRWTPESGGSLHVLPAAGSEIEIPAEYNSLVAFDVLADAQHRVDTVTAGSRLTIGGWYPNDDG